jgi:hypothetical protein
MPIFPSDWNSITPYVDQLYSMSSIFISEISSQRILFSLNKQRYKKKRFKEAFQVDGQKNFILIFILIHKFIFKILSMFLIFVKLLPRSISSFQLKLFFVICSWCFGFNFVFKNLRSFIQKFFKKIFAVHSI